MSVTKEQVLDTLRAHERELRNRGVLHAALFGSVARGEAKPDSDIDILVELAPDVAVGVYEYVGIEQYLSDLLASHVDLANRKSLKAFVRPSAERDAIYAF
jgi:predicted nucleotidyltransferase